MTVWILLEYRTFLALFAIQASLKYGFIHNLVLCYYKLVLYNVRT